MNYEIIVMCFLLFLFSLIDYKFKAIPSVFLTSIIIVLLFLHPAKLYFGILALVYALFLYEFTFIEGIADIKIITMIGLMINSISVLGIFMILVVLYGTIWKLLVRWMYKRSKIKCKTIAFIPVLFFVFITLVMSSMI